jgi:hypothetical protein
VSAPLAFIVVLVGIHERTHARPLATLQVYSVGIDCRQLPAAHHFPYSNRNLYSGLHLLRPATGSRGGSSRGSTLRLRVFLFPVQSSPPSPFGLLDSTAMARHAAVLHLLLLIGRTMQTGP